MNCPICHGSLEERDVAPCFDCGDEPQELDEMIRGEHTYGRFRVFGQEIVPMSKSTFYFSVIVLVAVEIIQSGYSRKLNAERAALQKHS